MTWVNLLELSQVHPLILIASTIVVVIFIWRIRRRIKRRPVQKKHFTSEYFKGLNYLLNDEQGKALDIFVKLVEADWEIIDTHFALGKIFRKNGEIDKAIKIHQGLIARPSLPEKYKSKVLLELGFDYLGAGWFDRAEGLFKEVLIQDKTSAVARRNLILIYQQEKDWHKAIDVAVDLFAEDPGGIGPMISQYYCELADQARAKGDVKLLESHANQALRYDASSVRASILLARQCIQRRDYKQAIRYFEQIESQDADFIPEILPDFIDCYEQLGDTGRLIDYLSALVDRQQHIDLIENYARVLEKYQGLQAVIDFLRNKIEQQPSIKGIYHLLNYYQKQMPACEAIVADLKNSLQAMQENHAEYKCHRCGFEANTLYWLCPSCNHWGEVKPSEVDAPEKNHE
jgi:lipopolysaccharide biosynthesis regulator YciM